MSPLLEHSVTSLSRIRAARPGDAPLIYELIRALARYERLEHEVVGTAELLHEHLFGARPICEALICEAPEPVGFALFFPTYSTFKTGPCLHLEDLYVEPEHRGYGYGKALLGEVHRLAAARGMARVTWNVLDWNAPAIAFYEGLGAHVLPDWRTVRTQGPEIAALAARARP